ncbi:MAG: hypothetical protein IPM18_07490 [Phycisphaerales bacterium]|nr:hypothetical protein [Phycisphaerales bacterium]
MTTGRDFALAGAALFCLAWCTVCAASATEPRRYDGYRVARVPIATAADLERIEALGGDLWAASPATRTADVLLAPGQEQALTAAGFSYTIWIADVQALIDQERGVGPREFLDDYRSYDEIVDYLTQRAAAHPTLATMFIAGTTIEDRPIWGVRVAGPNLPEAAPVVFYFCTVHAREWITTTVVPYLVDHLLARYGTDPQITDLLDHVAFVLIPVGNPDGYEYTRSVDRLWRKNRRDNGNGTFGVDINRNWAYQWGGIGSSSFGSSNTFRGPFPFSEPETQALRNVFLANWQVRAMLDIHSYSQLILWPWGYTPELCPDEEVFSELGLAMQQLVLGVHGKFYEAGPSYTTIYPTTGASKDWGYGARGTWAFTYELRDTGQFGFVLPASQIRPNNEEILPALLFLANSSAVRATQFNFPEGRPEIFYAGQPTRLAVAITSGVESVFSATAAVHYRYDPGAPFTTLPLTAIGPAAFEVFLPPTHCRAQPEYFFTVEAEGGVRSAPSDAPLSLFTAGMLSGGVIFAEPLDVDPGWATEGLWAYGQPTGGGGTQGSPDPVTGYTGHHVYGYNLLGDYPNLMPAPRYLTSTPIDCRVQWGLRLSYWRWLGVERRPFDYAEVAVSNDGLTWVPLWQNTATVTDNSWRRVDYDISAVADNQSTVYLRWSLGPTDAGWSACGWNIDDIEIYATDCVGFDGDWNGNGSLDAGDFLALADCLRGPGVALGPDCGVFDWFADGDIALEDVAAFQRAFGGP